MTGEGAGPFTTRLTWTSPEGATATWESRTARKRGTVAVQAAEGAGIAIERADSETARRLLRLNTVAAAAFTIGGLLFVLGAGVAQFGSGNATTSACIYFAGGLCFNTGAYASLLQAINAPRIQGGGASLAGGSWRWWSYEPLRIDWLSAFVLFAGTLVFGINLLDSFIEGLSVKQVNRLIWAPDMVGSILFLVSGHLALTEICHGRPCWRRRELGWWIVAVNQLGSALFFASALAAFTRPATGSLVTSISRIWAR
jgi:hypothetical protein